MPTYEILIQGVINVTTPDQNSAVEAADELVKLFPPGLQMRVKEVNAPTTKRYAL